MTQMNATILEKNINVKMGVALSAHQNFVVKKNQQPSALSFKLHSCTLKYFKYFSKELMLKDNNVMKARFDYRNS